MDDTLVDACKQGDLVAVATALQKGADVHCYGDAPMFQAATNGHFAIVQHLWVHAPIPRVFHVGQGTLRKAAQKGYTDIVMFLVSFATPPEIEAAIAAAHRSHQPDIALALESILLSKK
jgi:hypothetical protein